MSEYNNLITSLRKRAGPLVLEEILRLQELQTLPEDALGPGSIERGVAAAIGDVVSVRSYGAIGDGDSHSLSELYTSLATAQLRYPEATALTDEIDWCAGMRAMAVMSAAGGGDVLWPRGHYVIHRAMNAYSNIRCVGTRGTKIENTYTSASVVDFRAVWEVGNLHGLGFYQSASAPTKWPSWAINNVADGEGTVTTTTAGDASNFAIGDAVYVRSIANYTAGSVEIPNLFYFSYVEDVTGAVITLRDDAPFAITSATIAKVTGTCPTTGEPWFAVENFEIDNFKLDALSPIYGGGCHGFRMARIEMVGKLPGNFFVMNTIINGVIEKCKSNYYYRWDERKLGCRNVVIRDCVGRWRPGTAVASPVDWGECSVGLSWDNNRLIIPPDFDDVNQIAILLGHGRDYSIRNSRLQVLGTMGAAIGLSTATVAERGVIGVDLSGLKIKVSALTSYGIQMDTAGAAVPTDVSLNNIIMTGPLKGSTNQWLKVGEAKNVVVGVVRTPDGNPGMSATANVTGLSIAAPVFAGQGGLVQGPLQIYYQWIKAGETVKTLGVLPLRGSVIMAGIDVLTVFNGSGTDTLTIGHLQDNDAYMTAVNGKALGPTFVYPGHASAGVSLGKREGSAQRSVSVGYTAGGSAASQGQALAWVLFFPLIPTAP